MVNISSKNNQRVTVRTNNTNNVSASSPSNNSVSGNTNADAQLARSWAVGEGLIQGEDYSAKYYAQHAQQDVDEIVANMTGEQNIIITKNGRNITISNKHYEHTQATPSNTWEINHNLNKRCPKVILIDSTGSVYYPAVDYTDENNCVINLIGQMIGTAYLE